MRREAQAPQAAFAGALVHVGDRGDLRTIAVEFHFRGEEPVLLPGRLEEPLFLVSFEESAALVEVARALDAIKGRAMQLDAQCLHRPGRDLREKIDLAIGSGRFDIRTAIVEVGIDGGWLQLREQSQEPGDDLLVPGLVARGQDAGLFLKCPPRVRVPARAFALRRARRIRPPSR